MTVDAADCFTADGAARLARLILNYWSGRGVSVWTEKQGKGELPDKSRGAGPRYVVRSDMVDGLPRRFQGR